MVPEPELRERDGRDRSERSALTWTGQRLERVEDEALLSGTARFIADIEPVGLELGEISPAAAASPELDLSIEHLDLSERPRNCLKRAQVNSIGELLEKTEEDLLAITNFGQKSLDEVAAKLDERGLSLATRS